MAQKHERVDERKAIRFSLADSLVLLGASPSATLSVDHITESVQLVDNGATSFVPLQRVLAATNVNPPSNAKVSLEVDPNGGGLKFLLHTQKITVYTV